MVLSSWNSIGQPLPIQKPLQTVWPPVIRAAPPILAIALFLSCSDSLQLPAPFKNQLQELAPGQFSLASTPLLRCSILIVGCGLKWKLLRVNRCSITRLEGMGQVNVLQKPYCLIDGFDGVIRLLDLVCGLKALAAFP